MIRKKGSSSRSIKRGENIIRIFYLHAFVLL